MMLNETGGLSMKKRNIVILTSLLVLIALIIGGYFHIFYKLYQFYEEDTRMSKLDEDSLYVKQMLEEEGSKEISYTDDDTEEELEKYKEQETNIVEEEEVDPYLKMINESDRVNILCLGYAKGLTDTIIVASFEPNDKLLDLISIPRDTYLHREGYDSNWQKKINAAYTGKDPLERAHSAMDAARDVLHIPIHHFVWVKYEGVEKIVDTIGGVEVNIPFKMDYDDPEDDLHIHFTPGTKLLNGEESVEFLRYRKNNDNTHSDGDIGRIARQQEFLNNAIRKSLGPEILKVIDVAQKYVRTSLTPNEMIFYANKLRLMDEENIETYMLPGYDKYKNGVSYYFGKKEETVKMITEIYSK